jgi:hypothetical protein
MLSVRYSLATRHAWHVHGALLVSFAYIRVLRLGNVLRWRNILQVLVPTERFFFMSSPIG